MVLSAKPCRLAEGVAGTKMRLIWPRNSKGVSVARAKYAHEEETGTEGGQILKAGLTKILYFNPE